MNTKWRWCFRLIVSAGLLLAAFFLLGLFLMSRPNVDQSDGYVSRTPEAIQSTISQSLPDAASKFRFASASVGMGGRLLIYRFTAPAADLHLHAEKEFDAHWDALGFTTTSNSPSPFRLNDTERYHEFYGVDAVWMLPLENAVGTVYQSKDGKSSHHPLIFVDDVNGLLYFAMSD